jgi:ferredoxin-type protein NapG
MSFNRRQLFKLRIGDLTRKFLGEGESEDPDVAEATSFPRPPGALRDAAAFLDTCERCGACASACPHDAIFKHGAATGRHEGSPFLDPAQSPCRWCEDMPCIEACPSGALAREAGIPVPPVAKVSLDLDRCLNTSGILCDTCSFRCPTHIKAIRMVDRLPLLDAATCTGCGMCVYHCEAEPSAFSFTVLEGEPQP